MATSAQANAATVPGFAPSRKAGPRRGICRLRLRVDRSLMAATVEGQRLRCQRCGAWDGARRPGGAVRRSAGAVRVQCGCSAGAVPVQCGAVPVQCGAVRVQTAGDGLTVACAAADGVHALVLLGRADLCGGAGLGSSARYVTSSACTFPVRLRARHAFA